MTDISPLSSADQLNYQAEQVQEINATSIESDQDLVSKIVEIVQSDISFSDILMHEGEKIKVRQAKKMTTVSDWPVSRNALENLFNGFDDKWEAKIQTKAIDRAFDFAECRIRANCFTYMGGKKLGVVIRKFGLRPLSFEQIGLDEDAISLASIDNGMVLVIGDTCQGKSTTLASMLDSINRKRSGHIITIEEPIEGIIPSEQCVVTQREVGDKSDVQSFFDGARDALRERPDVVMIGEIRDSETATEALALSESGPVVFGSLHARTPEQAITKFCRLLGDEKHQRKAFASALRGIICQSLVPSKDGETYVLATEVLKIDPTIIEYIENSKLTGIRATMKTLSTSNVNSGTHTMNTSLKKLKDSGKITIEDARKASTDREDFEQIFKC